VLNVYWVACSLSFTVDIQVIFLFSAHGIKKLSDARLAKAFQAVLVEFQNAQKIAQEWEKNVLTIFC